MNIISPINQLGYGLAGFNIVKELSSQDPETTALWVIGQPHVTNQKDADTISMCLKNALIPDFKAPCLRVWHQHDMSQFVGRGEKIGFPFFELDSFNDIEKYHLNSLDRLFVTSDWAREIALNNLSLPPDRINIVPLGVDSSLFSNKGQSSSKNTIFFNCGKWEIRKGHDVLCDIFNEAFSEDDDVELWLMTNNPFLTEDQDQEWKKLYINSKLGSKIKFIERVDTQKEVYNIMEETDCGIFPSRAEGWNLELLEMMACGKHVITTNYSAHKEFCNNSNALLVDTPETEIAYDGKWFHGKLGCWSKISKKEVSKFADYMKEIHLSKQNNNLGINTAGLETARQFSWKNTAQKIRDYIYV